MIRINLTIRSWGIRYQTDRDSFITKLANVLTNNVIHDMCCAIENANLDINIITDKFISIFKQAGEDFQKKPKVTRINTSNQPWFDSNYNN